MPKFAKWLYINLPIWSDMDWIPWHQEVAMTVFSTCHTLCIPAQIWSQWGVEEDHPSHKFKFGAFWSFKLSHESFLEILLWLEWAYCRSWLPAGIPAKKKSRMIMMITMIILSLKSIFLYLEKLRLGPETT